MTVPVNVLVPLIKLIRLQIKNVFIALIDRLAIYASTEGVEIPSDLPLFEIFSKQTQSVIMSREGMPLEDVVSLQVCFLELHFGFYRIFGIYLPMFPVRKYFNSF